MVDGARTCKALREREGLHLGERDVRDVTEHPAFARLPVHRALV